MQDFPNNTVITKVIPKAKFYDRLDIGSAVKQHQIDVLSKKMRAEKQPHKAFELFQQIKELQRQQEVPLEGE